ncbi:MAG: S8 family serine peptidase [Meiothermus sp.]|nr:S8 family serine peptidase [Meiothermus sp.]
MIAQTLKLALVGSLVAVLAACGSAPTQATSPGGSGYLLTVQLEPADTQETVAQRYGGEVIAWLDGQAILRMTGEAVAQLQSRGVSMQGTTLEGDTRVRTPSTVNAVGWNAWSSGWNAWSSGWNAWSSGTGSITNFSTENNALWTQIGLSQAHSLASNLGQNVKVAVIDSGVDLNHPALASRLIDRYDFVDNDGIPQEVGMMGDRGFGHGTAVAGIVAQVAPSAMIMAYRVLGPDGSGSLSNVIAAINTAIGAGAQVINLSLGADSPSAALTAVLNSATSRKIYVVAAAGNANADGLDYPARQSKTLDLVGTSSYLVSVSSVDASDVKSGFANYGSSLDMTAPGERIATTAPGSRVASWSGTSMAAPLVSGSLALALGQGRGNLSSLKGTLTNNGISITLKNLPFFGKLGSSRLQVANFLNAAPW